MSTVNHRHTYYGGPSDYGTSTAITTPHTTTSHSSRKRQVTFGPYVVGSTLGEGEFGKVKLGWAKDAQDHKQVAIKLIRRDTIPKHSDRETKIHREINALKHLTHPNIVKLEEVLQNSKYIGIVLEYASGGEFYKYIQRKRRLKEPNACRLFAQLVSGVYYMHSKGLVHRDLKLENLLLDKHENLIITDFGFVNEFSVRGSDLMKTSCGSPCYAAPELVVSSRPYESRKADVWSCGVIMYAMLAGYLPWDDDPKNPEGDNISRLYQYITQTPLKFPEYIYPVPRDLLRRILVSDPRRRLTVKEVRSHQWLAPHAPFLSVTPEEWDRTFKLGDSEDVVVASSASVSSAKRNSYIDPSSSVLFSASPLPPQASSAVAIPSSPSSATEIRRNSGSPVKGHKKSDSVTSVALQALVDADDQRHGMSPGQKTASPVQNAPVLEPPPAFVISPAQSSKKPSAKLAPSDRRTRPMSYQPGPYQQGTGTFVATEDTRFERLPTVAAQPSLDLQNVEGDLIRKESAAKKIQDAARPSSQRFSASLTADLYDKIFGETSEHVGEHSKSAAPQSSSLQDTAAPVTKETRYEKLIQQQNANIGVHDGTYEQLVNGTQRMSIGDQELQNDQYAAAYQRPQSYVQQRYVSVAESHDSGPGDNERKKRFSLLSFYASYSDSKASLVTKEKSTPGSRIASDNRRHTMAATPTLQKPEVSNSQNVNSKEIPKKPQAMSQEASREKHQSTAKRVMDFFKRRSTRLG